MSGRRHVFLFRAQKAAAQALTRMLLVHGKDYDDVITAPLLDHASTKEKNVEHILCAIAADLRMALAEVESERLRRFGWNRPDEETAEE